MAKSYLSELLEKEAQTQQLNCFIIMPFTSVSFTDAKKKKQSLKEQELKHIYEELLLKAVKNYNRNNVSFLNVHRSNTQRGNFVKDIVGRLQDYDLVIADLTGSNPNVFYELGIRHTLRNGTIMISQNVSHLPSDLKNYIGVEYKYYRTAVEFTNYYPEFEDKIHSLIDDVLLDTDKIDNPVREFIGNKQIFKHEERIHELESNITLMLTLRQRYCHVIIQLFCYLQGLLADDPFVEHLHMFLKQISEAFLYKIVNSQIKDIEVIKFLDNLILSSELIRINFGRPNLRHNVAFYTHKDQQFSLFSLLDCYKNVVKRDMPNGYITSTSKINPDEPMLKSFDYFVEQWRHELNSLI